MVIHIVLSSLRTCYQIESQINRPYTISLLYRLASQPLGIVRLGPSKILIGQLKVRLSLQKILIGQSQTARLVAGSVYIGCLYENDSFDPV